jgi:hypothetical protein
VRWGTHSRGRPSRRRATARYDSRASRSEARRLATLGRSLTALLVAVAALGLSIAAFASTEAAAEGAPSAAGTWSCCGAGGAGEQVFLIEESGGSLSGTMTAPNGEPVAPISGSISGSSVSITTGPYHGSSYTATFVGTISGETMSGTWTSNAHQEGTWTATRTGGAKSKEEIEKAEAAKKAKEKEEQEAKGKRKAAIQINCNLFDPFLPTEYDQCTAQIGDASGRSPAERPTGTVSFTVNPGGGGGIRGSSTCALAASQTAGASSFCAVSYIPPSTGLPIGSQPPITATYSGDNTFSSVAGKPTGSPVREALTGEDIFESLCKEVYFAGCSGHFPVPADLTGVCASLLVCGAPEPQVLMLVEGEPWVVADVDCPITEGPLTDCELEMLWKGNAPPELLAKSEYYAQARAFSRQLDTVKSSVLESVERQLFIPALIRYRGEDPALQKSREEAAHAEQAFVDKKAKEYFEQLAVPGAQIPEGPGPQLNVSARCPSIPQAQDVLHEQEACEQITKSINEALATAYKQVIQKKEEAGLTVPFKTAKKASASAASRRTTKRRAPHRADQTLLAASGRVTVRAGKTAKIRLAIPAYARADLNGCSPTVSTRCDPTSLCRSRYAPVGCTQRRSR